MRKNLSPSINSHSESYAKTTQTLPHLLPAVKTSLVQSAGVFLVLLRVCHTEGGGLCVLFFQIVHAEGALHIFVIFGWSQAGSCFDARMTLNNLWTQQCVVLLILWLGSCEARFLFNINLWYRLQPVIRHLD